MADTQLTSDVPEPEALSGIYDEGGFVDGAFLERIEAAIEGENPAYLREEVGRLHESELGDLLEALDNDARQSLVRLMGDEFDYTALTEVDEAIRLSIVDAMPNAQVAEALRELGVDQFAGYLQHDNKEETLRVYGEHVIPAVNGSKQAKV
mgnify:CR=1 FL=1